MKSRCNNPRHKHFQHYGGRGITVCPEWDGFEQFLADMGHRPSPKHSLDRIDNDGNYEPSNCRWALHQIQMSNKSTTVRLTYDGRTESLAEWGRLTNIPADTLRARLKRYGWSVEKTLTTAVASKEA